MLLLDEFQTWYDGLTNTKQYPWKNWAFNFIQILSEIAKERPDLLVLVISVRNGGSDAYQQVHRVNPVAIDFKAGGSAERIQQDRRRMLLHRLFENRLQIASGTIESLVAQHVAESFRLLDVPSAEQERKRREFTESWPYAPHLLRLLEEQVLIATDAQEICGNLWFRSVRWAASDAGTVARSVFVPTAIPVGFLLGQSQKGVLNA